MIIERFLLKYSADTRDVTNSLDDIEKRSKKVGKGAGGNLGQGLNDGLKDVEAKTAQTVARMEAMLNRLGRAGGGAGSVGVSLMSKLPGMAAIAGVGTLGTVAGATAAGIAALALSVAAANREAKKAEDQYKKAWETSRNLTSYNKGQIFGSRLGATEEQTTANLSGIAQKAMSAINQPFSEQAYWIKRSGMGSSLSNLRKTGDIEKYTEQVMEHARAMAKTRGEAQALAWATNRMGADFETTRRYIKLTDDQLRTMKQGLGEEAAQRRLMQAEMDRYVDAQRRVDSEMSNINRRLAGAVTPSLTKFTDKLGQIAGESGGLVDALGSIAAALINLATTSISIVDDLIHAASGGYKDVYSKRTYESVDESMDKIKKAKMQGRSDLVPEYEAQLKAAMNGYVEAAKSAGMGMQEIQAAINHLNKKYGREEIAMPKDQTPAAPKIPAPEYIKGSDKEDVVGRSAREKANEGFDKVQKAIDKYALGDKNGAAELQKSLNELKNVTQDAAKDGTLREFIKTLSGQLEKVAGTIEAGDGAAAQLAIADTQQVSRDMTKTNETFKAQREHTQPVRVVQMPPPIGLEQALSLWAAGVGKAAGLRSPSDPQPNMQTGTPPVTSGSIGVSRGRYGSLGANGQAGESWDGIGRAEPAGSRADWEQEARRQQQQKLSPTYQPNALVGADRMRQAIGSAANVGVSRMGSGQIVINQHNTNAPNIKVSGGADKTGIEALGTKISETWDNMTQEASKHAVNEFSDNWKA